MGNKDSGRKPKWSKKDCEKALKKYVKKYKENPDWAKWRKRKIKPSTMVLVKIYGSFGNALLSNGLPTNMVGRKKGGSNGNKKKSCNKRKQNKRG